VTFIIRDYVTRVHISDVSDLIVTPLQFRANTYGAVVVRLGAPKGDALC